MSGATYSYGSYATTLMSFEVVLNGETTMISNWSGQLISKAYTRTMLYISLNGSTYMIGDAWAQTADVIGVLGYRRHSLPSGLVGTYKIDIIFSFDGNYSENNYVTLNSISFE